MSDVRKVKREKIMVDIGDGVERELKYTMNSFAELELKYGSQDELMGKVQSGSMIAQGDFIWAGLMHNDEEITPKYVLEQVDMRDLDSISRLAAKAMGQDVPEEDEKDPN